MAGPWEQYQAQPQAQDGPWAKYAQPTQTPEALASEKRMLDPAAGMNEGEKFRAGIGKAFSDLGTGVSQFGAGVADFFSPRQTSVTDLILNRKPLSRVEEMRQQVAEARRRDAPLMDTGAGVAGNVVGNVAAVAPTAVIPGANTYAGATAIGALTGLAQPSASTNETLLNAGLGGAGGAAGKGIADAAGKFVANRTAAATAAQAQNAQKVAAAQAAAKAGYVIPPEDLGGGAITKAVSGLSGKIKTAQEASARNQPITNALVKQELGLAADAPVDIGVLNGIRQQAGQAYQSIRGTGTVMADQQFGRAVSDIATKYKTAVPSFPGLGKTNMHGQQIDDIANLVGSLKAKSFDASEAVDALGILREMADKAYSAGDKTLGKATKEAAVALEDLLGRHVAASGNPDLLAGFQQARQLIAKTYTAQKALNPMTGDFNAQVLKRELAKQRPLTGGMRTVAETATAFEKATQALKETPKSLSPLDFAAAGGMLAGTGGNPLAAAGLLARPGLRSALLSGPVQRNALANAGKVAGPNALARLLQNEPVSLPMGVLGGTGLANYLAQQ